MISIPDEIDMLVVGGGINGVGIARDAAGRGLKVLLCEQHDLAGHTSSASSKLIHGGLRYLEQYEFRLVRESLGEREVLLRAAPHIVHPMRFVMPHMAALRPAWMIRAGLFLYDYLARRDTLPGSSKIELRAAPYNSGLKPGLTQGFIYSDCWVDDARLVLATARSAAAGGATLLTRTSCTAAQRSGNRWRVTLHPEHTPSFQVSCRALVNATGPWTKTFINKNLQLATDFGFKLVKGSHIVVPRLYEGEHAFILQNDDRRVVFVYPYEGHTLIGTTDVEHSGDPGDCTASAAEVDYLCRAANGYFSRQTRPADVLWRYAGIRPLFDDGAQNVSKITRDYTLRVDGESQEAPVLSVFGGKITTYRKLAEHALEKLRPWLPEMKAPWTEAAFLPGGDLHGITLHDYIHELHAERPGFPLHHLAALVARHGSVTREVLGEAQDLAACGPHFGHTLYANEVDYLIQHEWARTADDILWRRTKCGLHTSPQQQQALATYVCAATVR